MRSSRSPCDYATVNLYVVHHDDTHIRLSTRGMENRLRRRALLGEVEVFSALHTTPRKADSSDHRCRLPVARTTGPVGCTAEPRRQEYGVVRGRSRRKMGKGLYR